MATTESPKLFSDAENSDRPNFNVAELVPDNDHNSTTSNSTYFQETTSEDDHEIPSAQPIHNKKRERPSDRSHKRDGQPARKRQRFQDKNDDAESQIKWSLASIAKLKTNI